MRIVVLSDSHVNQLEDLPERIVEATTMADLIIHAGDFTDVGLLTGLRQLKEVRAVQGNMDSMRLRTILPTEDIVEVHGKRIGVVHGSGAPTGIDQRVRTVFRSYEVDAIVYGHSHRAQNEVIDGVLLFNPGAASDSFGVIEVDAGGVRGEIIPSR